MSTQVFGFKIILQDKDNPVTEDTSIGLYNVASDNSEFRWIQNAISGVTDWTDKMIVEKGIKPFSIEIDLKRLGSCSFPGKGSITVKNSSSFWKAIDTLGINLTGLRCEIWLFNGTTPSRYRSYKCEEPSWDSREYTIPFKGAQENRNANIMNTVTSVQFPHSTKATIGKTMPATFGRLYKSLGSIAKCLMVDNTIINDEYDLKYFNPNSPVGNSNNYPVIDGGVVRGYPTDPDDLSTPSYVDLQLNESVTYPFPSGYSIVTIANSTLCMRVTEGDGEGQIRRINNIMTYRDLPGIGDHLRFFLDDFTMGMLSNEEASRSWVAVERIEKSYSVDHWPCAGMIDNDGNPVANDGEAYIYDSELDQIMQQNSIAINGSKNNFSFNKANYSGPYDSVKAYKILPVDSIELYTAPDLSNWASTVGSQFNDFNLAWTSVLEGGFYNKSTGPDPSRLFPSLWPVGVENMVEGLDNVKDKNKNTYATIAMRVWQDDVSGSNNEWIKAIKINLPNAPDNFTFDKCYIGLRFKTHCSRYSAFGGYDSSFMVMWRRFKYGIKSILEASKIWEGFDWDDTFMSKVDCIPNFYYAVGAAPTWGNKAFYYPQTYDGSHIINVITGVENFELTDITNKDKYKAIAEMCLFFHRTHPKNGISYDDSTYITEACVIFEKTSSLTDIGCNVAGRTFNDTWEGRKTSTDLLVKPGDILEHLSRLQDYRDKCPTPPSGWGLQYASSPLIATRGFGSFDDLTTRDYQVAAQFTEYDEGYTESLKQSLCRNFALANWQDADGYERVIPLPSSPLVPVYTVLLSDVMDRNKIRVMDPKQSDIYPEPFVRYNKNPMSGEYEGQMSIFNSSATMFVSSYVDGVQNPGEAQALWIACHSLSLKTHQTGKPPTDLTDLTWANGPGGYSIALAHLQRWIAWQSASEIEFPLHFNIAGSWQECTPINIVFSHQTSNVVRHALVESSTVNPNPPYDVMLKAIMYA